MRICEEGYEKDEMERQSVASERAQRRAGSVMGWILSTDRWPPFLALAGDRRQNLQTILNTSSVLRLGPFRSHGSTTAKPDAT
jgi:hypothetical protein